MLEVPFAVHRSRAGESGASREGLAASPGAVTVGREGGLSVGGNRWRVVLVASLAVVALGAPGAAGAAAAGPDQGVSGSSVKIGFVTSKTGPAASTSGLSDVGCRARIGRANAEGGVAGRKIDLVTTDDKTSANLQSVQDLVDNQHVFMVVNDSALAFLSYRWLLDNGVPMIGGGFDGNYYGAPGNENIISAFGNGPPAAGIQTTITPEIMKALGAKNIAAVGYGSSPSSVANVKSFQDHAVPALGLKAAYTNTSVDFGTSDVGPIALAMKNARVDGAYYAMDLSTDLALGASLVQNNVDMKAQIMPTGYGQALLDQPVAKTLGPDVVLTSIWAPVEIKSKATKRFQHDLEQYASYKGVPDFGVYSGYIACDLAVMGLEQQGKTLDRATFSNDLRAVGKFNPGGGLGCSDAELSLGSYGKIDESAPADGRQVCTWALQVKDGKFALLEPKGGRTTYWTGDLIESSVDPQYLVTTTSSPHR